MRHKIIAVMENNNGDEIGRSDLIHMKRLLEANGWTVIDFKRVRQSSKLGRELLTKVWDFIVE